jgi:hypothetical protein
MAGSAGPNEVEDLMPTYLLSYRVPKTPLLEVLAERSEEQRASRAAAWNSWIDSIGDNLVERGRSVGAAHAIGNCDGEMRAGGYSLVAAKNLEEAVRMAEACPWCMGWGGGVEVGELLELQLAPAR